MKTIQLLDKQKAFDKIEKEILSLSKGESINFHHLSGDDVQELINSMGDTNFEILETNGYDMDWSNEFTYDGDTYEIWGSIRGGNTCIQKL